MLVSYLGKKSQSCFPPSSYSYSSYSKPNQQSKRTCHHLRQCFQSSETFILHPTLIHPTQNQTSKAKELVAISANASNHRKPSPARHTHPHRSLQSLSQKFGELILLHLGNRPALVVSSASAAQEIMKTHDIIFSNRPHLTIASKPLFNAKDVSLAPYGEYWRQMRTISILQLLSNRRVGTFR
ncbi:Cytochrome P450 71A3-like protein [Drosera capensis]